jgi:DNA-binding response OmpR family regulator
MYRPVVLIEPDAYAVAAYSAALRREGFSPVCTSSGTGGVECVTETHPVLVVMELDLQDVPGPEVIRRLKEAPSTSQIPILAIAGGQQPRLVSEAWAAGADQCLLRLNCTPALVATAARDLLESSGTAPVDPSPLRIVPPRTQAAPVPAARPRNPAAPPPEPPARDEAAHIDTTLQALRAAFPATASEQLSILRQALQNALRNPTAAAAAPYLESILDPLRTILSQSVLFGYREFARLAEAADSLVAELLKRRDQIGFSPLRTLALSVDSMSTLSQLANSGMDLTQLLSPLAMVADDDPIVSQLVARAMERAGINAVRVNDAPSALALAKNNRFNLFLLDIQMPDMNGIELCHNLRQQSAHASAPVIFVTAAGSTPEMRAVSHRVGGTDYVTKPFLASELSLKALTHLSRARPAEKA